MIPALLPVYKRIQIEFTHGAGAYLFDKDGNCYLDFAAGYAANSLGHCHPKLVAALGAQIERVWHLSNKFTVPGLEEYCQRLVSMTTFAKTAFIASAGAEAVECMIKMGRRYFSAMGQSKKYRFITFDGAFHGRTMACISAGSKEKIEGFEPALDGFDRVPWDDIEAVKKAITSATAGILIEPIQGEGGMRECSHHFMQELKKLCIKHDLLLMLDEVQCGMGRTGFMFAHQMYGVEPDIVALGKGLGCGFPISACLATEKVGKAMYVGSHGSTFGGNPLAVAVGNAVLDIMSEEAFVEHVKVMMVQMKHGLQELAGRYPHIIAGITGAGLMLGLRLHAEYEAEVVADICAQELLITMPASQNVLRMTPPLIIQEEHCKEALEKLEEVMNRLSSTTFAIKNTVKNAAHGIKRKLGLEEEGVKDTHETC